MSTQIYQTLLAVKLFTNYKLVLNLLMISVKPHISLYPETSELTKKYFPFMLKLSLTFVYVSGQKYLSNTTKLVLV